MRVLYCLIISCLFMLHICSAGAQERRPLEHEDYDLWNSITGTTLSSDGEWLMYTVRDGKDNSTLNIRGLETSKQYKIKNATGPRISYDSKYVAYRAVPDKELIKKLKKEGKKGDELPQEKFEILNLDAGKTETIRNVASFSFPSESGDWLAIKLKAPKKEKPVEQSKPEKSEVFEVTEEGLKRPGKKSKKKKESKKEKKPEKEKKAEDKKSKKEKQNGTMLVLKHLGTNVEHRFPFVTSFRFDKLGKGLAFATSNKDDSDADGVWYFDLGKRERTSLVSGLGNYKNITFNEQGTQLAFITDKDDYQSKDSSWNLYLWRTGTSAAKKIVGESMDGVPADWWVSANASPFFAESGKFLFYYTAPKPDDLNKDKKDEKEKDPVAKLDLWHWQDPLLQPQQLLQAQQERNRSYLAAFNLRTRKAAQLATKEIPDVTIDSKRDAEFTTGTSDVKYRKANSWDLPGFRDAYLINLRTGKSEIVLEKIRSGPQLSPAGKYLLWWDTDTRNWYSISTKQSSEKKNLTEKIEFPLYDELHDTPSEPRAYGIAGWTEKDKAVLVYDRYDIWQLDLNGLSDPVCITDSQGRENKIRFRRRQLDRDARTVDMNNMFLTAFNESNKDSGFYKYQPSASASQLKVPVLSSPEKAPDDGQADNATVNSQATSPLHKAIMLPESLGGLQKAQNSDRIVFTRSTFGRFPDIWTSDLEFKTIQRISKANPQQQDYAWGTVELTKWKSEDGQDLDGLLYKPDDFDPNKKYPLMVYFYERNSDNLHRHYVPAAGRSIINFTFYVSRGYVIFVPDIPYKTGEPGPSASRAVLPGVRHVVDMGFIDEKRIGTQGHSWGGYQTAYLVTQTDMFACAESGAPISNMTSAYGGIRWGSGLSRMFQYEKTQSRIGDTLWNAREKYIANSPLFFVDKINTPLLILHNDEDGAVPWYQGIEMFVAMRRLEKPAWLLNYNGNPHWVMGRENRLDFAKRMQQFFDHYLMDGPLPKWMAEGIPAVDKGKDFGFDEAEEKEEAESSEEKQEAAAPAATQK